MRTLYHLWLSPFCRKTRVALAEKKLDFELKAENPSERRTEFLALNPACDVPVLVEDGGPVISNSAAITEFLEEIRQDPPLYPGVPAERAELLPLLLLVAHPEGLEVGGGHHVGDCLLYTSDAADE